MDKKTKGAGGWPDIDRAHPPRTREELLAWDLANALDDPQGIRFYLSLAHKYPEAQLRRILAGVLEIPPEKIRKSRAALFNYLMQKHAPQNPKHPGD